MWLDHSTTWSFLLTLFLATIVHGGYFDNSVTRNQRQAAANFECKEEGYHADPHDCKIYYRCVDFGNGAPLTKFRFECGPGTVFSKPMGDICVHPNESERKECGDGNDVSNDVDSNNVYEPGKEKPVNNDKPESRPPPPVSSRPPSTSPAYGQSSYVPPSTGTTAGQKPSSVWENDDVSISSTEGINQVPNDSTDSVECTRSGFLADPQDCRKFYRCVEQGTGSYTKFEFSCADGTVWDPKIEGCNHPWAANRVDCKVSTGNPSHDSSGQNENNQGIGPNDPYPAATPLPPCKTETPPHSEGQQGYPDSNGGYPDVSEGSGAQQPEVNEEGPISSYPTPGPDYESQQPSEPQGPPSGYPSVDPDYESQPPQGPPSGYPQVDPDNESQQPSEPQGPPSGYPQVDPDNESQQPSEPQGPPPGYPQVDPDYESQQPQDPSPGNPSLEPDHESQSPQQQPPSSSTPGTCTSEGFFGDPNDCQKFYRCVGSGYSFTKYDFECGAGTVWDEKILSCNHLYAVPKCNGGATGTGDNAAGSGDNAAGSGDNGAGSGDNTAGSGSQTDVGSNEIGQGPSETSDPTSVEGSTSSSDVAPVATTESSGIEENGPQDTSTPDSGSSESESPISGVETSSVTEDSVQDISSSTTSGPTYLPVSKPGGTSPSPGGSLNNGECTSEGFFPDANDCKKFYRCVGDPGKYVKYEFQCGEGTGWDDKIQSCNHAYAVPNCGTDSASSQAELPNGNQPSPSEPPSEGSSSELPSSETSTSPPSDGSSSEPSSESSSTDVPSAESSSEPPPESSSTDSPSAESSSESPPESSSTEAPSAESSSEPPPESSSTDAPSAESSSEPPPESSSTDGPSAESSSESPPESSPGTGSSDNSSSQSPTEDPTSNQQETSSSPDESVSTSEATSESSEQAVTDSNESLNPSSEPPVSNTSDGPEEGAPNQDASTEGSASPEATSTAVVPMEGSDGTISSGGDQPTKPEEGSGNQQSSGNSGKCMEPGFFANKNDCTKFYRCVGGGPNSYTKYEFSCAPGTAWDQKILTCNHIYLVNTCKAGDNNEVGGEKEENGQESSSSESSPNTGNGSGEEGDMNNVIPVKPINMAIPPDSTSESSESSSSSSTSSSTSESSSSEGSSDSESSSKPCDKPKPDGNNNGIVCNKEGFYANPRHCDKFYRCVDNGNGFNVYYFDCPPGTIFDPSISVCNYPESVYPARNCEEGQDSGSSDKPASSSTTTEEPTTSNESAEGETTTKSEEETSSAETTSGPSEEVTTASSEVTPENSSETATEEAQSTTSQEEQSTPEGETESSGTQTSTESQEGTTSGEENPSPTETEQESTESGVPTTSTEPDEASESIISGDTNQEVTTSSSESSGTTPCPLGNLTGEQIVLVCPTGFKRHPKYCNVFYQCMSEANMDVKILTFRCPDDRIFDDEKIQCLPENESTKPCDGVTAGARFYRRVESSSTSLMKVEKRETLCPGVGHYPYREGCSNVFYKCKRDTREALQGYLYKCPENFVYWSVSRRCERATRMPTCSNTSYTDQNENNTWTGRWQLPVEDSNLSARKLRYR